jgi:O-antigen/teichoic acid export membrane protein
MFLMGAGAVLSLARGFGAAIILPATEFGLYALLVAVAAFANSLAGFGKIEESRKLFPRLAIDGHGRDIIKMADRLTGLVAIRLLIIAVPVIIASLLLLPTTWTIALFAALLLIFGIAWASILASALRAGTDLTALGIGNAARAALTIVLCLVGAQVFGFSGALCGEAVGAILGSAFMRFMLSKIQFPNVVVSPPFEGGNNKISKDGIYIFIASFAAAVPIYLGRSIVGAAYSDLDLGTYSFLMLVVTSVSVLMGISDQITGPKFIKFQHKGDSNREQLLFFRKVLFINVILTIAVCLVFFVLIFCPQIPYFAQKYGVHALHILPIVFYCIFQITTTVEWFLLAKNDERRIVNAAIIHLAFFLSGSVVAAGLGFSIIAILWVHAAAKLIQLLVQLHSSGVCKFDR